MTSHKNLIFNLTLYHKYENQHIYNETVVFTNVIFIIWYDKVSNEIFICYSKAILNYYGSHSMLSES